MVSGFRRVFVLLVAVAGVAALFPATAWAEFGIDPGKVYVDNLYPGAEADVTITVYNKNDATSTFNASVRRPDYTDPAYEILPYPEWLSIEPASVTIGPGGTAQVMVVIRMPKEATSYGGKKGEIWVGFKEEGVPGMVQVEIAARLLVSTQAKAVVTPAPTRSPVATAVPSSSPTVTPVPSATAAPPAVTPVATLKPADGPPGAPAGRPEITPVPAGGTAEPTATPAASLANGGGTPEDGFAFPAYLWVVIGVVGAAMVGGVMLLLAKRTPQT